MPTRAPRCAVRGAARAQRTAWILAVVGALLMTGSASGVAEEGGTGSIVAAQAAVRPRPMSVPAPVGRPVQRGGLPAPSAVRAAIREDWTSRWLGPASTRSLSVRDVETGEHLLELRPDEPLTPASTVKLLTAAAVMSVLQPDETMKTRVVAGERPGDVVLVAGGDLLLSTGAGDKEAVVGRAGLADLAEQTRLALQEGSDTRTADTEPSQSPAASVRVLLDTQYAAGAEVAPGWSDFWVNNGYAGPITMLGLADDRALPSYPSPKDPPLAAAEAFQEALRERGVAVSQAPVKRTELTGPDEAPLLGQVESAPVRDVLALALSTSDNAMIEQLARQAAVRDGGTSRQKDVNAWVLARLQETYGIDVSGARLADTSGLSDGTAVPVRVLTDVLVMGADGSHPRFQSVLGGLPVAGYTGTLADRFVLERAGPGIGVVRAKTGSLPRVTALAGTVVTRDGRLLAFAATAAGLDGSGTATLEARAALDSLTAQLASCGC